MSELAIIEIAPDLAPSIYVENGLDKFLEQIREGVNEVPDLSTAKGRARNYLPSADIQARIHEAKSVVLDESWQERAAEAGVAKDSTIQQLEASLTVAQKREHEAAELERLRKEAEEKARLEREETIRREAAEQAKRDAEAKAQAKIDAAARREAEARAATERAEREKIEAQQKAECEAKSAAEKAEQEKNEAIAAERRRQEELEAARLAEQKRIADEDARRAADKEHRRTINRQVIADLVAQGIPTEWAEKCLVSFASGKVAGQTIKY